MNNSVAHKQLWSLLLLVAISHIVAVGCQKQRYQRPSSESFSRSSTKQESVKESHLRRALETVERLYESDAEQALTEVQYQLNRWIQPREQLDNWIADPLTGRLPKEIRESDQLDGIEKLKFSLADCRALQEAVWARDISRRVAREPADERFAAWVRDRQPQLDDVQAEQLMLAERLFDWTIRNIQLEKLLAYPSTAIAAPGGASGRTSPARLALPGPGYRFHLWEVLLYGHGDALQRSQIFIRLARQQGIDAVMLAFPGDSIPPRPEPWVTGVLIGDEVFLFDLALGLPIPTESRGVATLAQVLDKPELLAAFDDEEQQYSIPLKQLKTLMALVDASPTDVSQRMKMVEQNLAGENRLILTTSPSGIAKRLREQPSLKQLNIEVRIWRVAYETIWFKESFMEYLKTNRQIRQGYLTRFGVFQTHNTLVRGRILHINGRFDEFDGESGAKQNYMESRLPQAAIDVIETNKDVQKQIGLVRGPNEKEFIWQFKLQNARMLATQSKQHASYWLGIVLYEAGMYDGAINWFDTRTLQAAHSGPWDYGAHYNLARTYEALGKYDKARELYTVDNKDPQGRGNRLRAKMLERWEAESTAAE